MKKLIYGTLFLAIVGVGVVACKKANINSATSNESKLENSPTDDIRVYKNSDAFYDEVNMILAMEHEERCAYENSLDYVSLGRYADGLYLAVNPENMSDDELRTYASANSEFLSIVQKDGEEYYETVFGDNPFRYMMNKNRMFQVGDKLYKVFPDGLVIANPSELVALQNYNPSKLKESHSQFSISLFERNEIEEKDVAHNCGLSFSGSQTNGSNRTNMNIFSWVSYDSSPNIGAFNVIRNEFVIRPYKKTAGIWYYCIRTITYDVRLAMDIQESNGTWTREFSTKSGTTSASKVGYLMTGRLTLGSTAPNRHFGGSKSFGDTPSTNHVYLNCNAHLF